VTPEHKRFERAFVWAGGGLFVGALAYAAWWYAVALGRAEPSHASLALRARAVAVDAVLFSAFAAHHSLFARTGAKEWLSRAVNERLLRSVYVWVASLLLIAVCALWQHAGGIVYSAPTWAAVLLAAIQLCGVVLIWRAVRAIDALELAGIHPARVDGALQITGPYRLVRHPLYLGWMLIVLLPPTLTGDRLVFGAVSSLYLVVAIPWEERSLESFFGDAYRRYRHRVQWRVIPYVY
jgi:protein-S-isoprenylcysteine O-methyltransferase Ste14